MLNVWAVSGTCRDGYLCLSSLFYWLVGNVILRYKLSRTKSIRIKHVTHKGLSKMWRINNVTKLHSRLEFLIRIRDRTCNQLCDTVENKVHAMS